MTVTIWQDGQMVVVRSRSGSISTRSKRQEVHTKSAVIVGGIPYGGSYEITPSETSQTLTTASRMLSQDITVGPIPSNYGLITWNGATLTVS